MSVEDRRPVVLHVMQSAGIGGAERHLLTLLPSLRETGFDARFWGFTDQGRSSFAEALHDVGVPTRLRAFTSPRSPRITWTLRQELKRTRPDILHTHLFYADVHGQVARLGTRIRSVRTVHGGQAIGDARRRVAFSLAGALADRTIVVSKYLASEAKRLRYAPTSKLRVITHGLAAERWEPSAEDRIRSRRTLALRDDDVAVCCTSRLFEGKGHETLIGAFATAKRSRPELVLILAGTGPLEAHLRTVVEWRLPPGSFRIVGFTEDVRPVLWASDVFVLPTLATLGEGFPMAPLEASAAGLPVVVSDLPPLHESVYDGSGVFVEPGDKLELARALVMLASDPAARSSMGRAGMRRVRDSFGHERMVAATAAVYAEILR